MAKDCFVEEYKNVVNNNNLQKLGELIINVTEKTITDASTQQKLVFNIISNSVTKIEVTDGGGFATSLADLESNPKTSETFTNHSYYSRTLYFKNANYKIKICTKYYFDDFVINSSAITIFSLSPSEFKYTYNLGNLTLSGVTYIGDTNIDFIKNMSQLQTIVLESTSVKGDLASISNLSSFERVTMTNCNVTGNLSHLGKNINLIQVKVNGSNISGSLEDFADSQITNGRTSGYVNVYCNGIITLSGNAVPNNTRKKIIFADGSYTIE